MKRLKKIYSPTRRLKVNFGNKFAFGANNITPIVFTVAIAIGIVLLISIVTLLFNLRNREQSVIPELVGDTLPVAILKLQERNLIPNLRLQYDDTPQTAGNIIKQQPSSGSLVRVGKTVDITMSRGSALYKLESFIGLTIETANGRIQEFEAEFDTQIQITNVSYVNHSLPQGVIIEQNPLPNSKIGSFVQLDLIVSLGEEERKGFVVPDLRGSHFENAIPLLLSSNVPFKFKQYDGVDRVSADDYKIISQLPSAGSILDAENLTFFIQPPQAINIGLAFGIYEYTLAGNSEVQSVRCEALLPNSEVRILAEFPIVPQSISLPYILPKDSVIRVVEDGNITTQYRVQ